MDTDTLQDELVKAIELANLWKMRARAAFEVADYLNQVYEPESPFMTRGDLKAHVERVANHLMDAMKSRDIKATISND